MSAAVSTLVVEVPLGRQLVFAEDNVVTVHSITQEPFVVFGMVKTERLGHVSHELLVERHMDRGLSGGVESDLARVAHPAELAHSVWIGARLVEIKGFIQAHWLPFHAGELVQIEEMRALAQCSDFWLSVQE